MSTNEDLPSTFIDKYGLERLLRERRPLLDEDYVFRPQRYPSLEKFDIIHDEVTFIKKPLAFVRDHHLRKREYEISTLKLNLHLCWNGFSDAVRLMISFVESFARQPRLIRIGRPSDDDVNQPGDVAIFLSWEAKHIDVLAFVRNNVMVSIQQQNVQNIERIALELDKSIRELKQIDEYSEGESLIFRDILREHGLKVSIPSGSYITFRNPDPEKRNLFFHATRGSINRDPAEPGVYYYRAGAPRKEEVIKVYQVGEGILPKMESLSLEIVEGVEN